MRGAGIDLLVDVSDGARITSLRAGGREWLAPGGPRSGTAFVQRGSGGWDEAVPTVAACVLADGTVLPDHGDAWRGDWAVTSRGADHLETTVRLASLPVTLRRRISATATGIRLSYSATTDRREPMPLLWAAHPLFAAEPGTRIALDGDPGSRVAPDGEPGSRVAPDDDPGSRVAPDDDPGLVEEYPQRGRALAWDAHRAAGHGALKAFTIGSHSSARVVHPDGSALRLDWDARGLPHLGLYWDADEFTPTPVVAIEPSTGRGDSAALAAAEGRVRMLSSAAPLRWWVGVTHSEGGPAESSHHTARPARAN